MPKKNKKANKIYQNQREQSKTGKNADDIFSPAKPVQQKTTVQEPRDLSQTTENSQQRETKEKQSRGRPVEHKEEWSKITVVLLDKQIHWLDQLASNIRLKTKAAVSRAELIRALIAAIEESNTDLSHLGSETSIKNFVLEKLKK